MSFTQWKSLVEADIREKRIDPTRKNIALLDTAMGSENAGDQIIMEACSSIISSLTSRSNLQRIPTHYYDPESEDVFNYLKILCGTNIIYKHMKGQEQWALPKDLSNYCGTLLFGVGMSDIGIDSRPSFYTKRFFKTILDKNLIHSVRDARTEAFFKSIGLQNVLNTSCPTTWFLTPDICKQIPVRRSKSVVTTITDYCFDPEADRFMLETLRAKYEKVYIWLQGSHDYDWCLQNLLDLSGFILVPGSLTDFDNILEQDDIDYVGTRLHAGIRALTKKHRSLIISIDNRARSMAADINLPILERKDIKQLPRLIESEITADITLPNNNISLWKSQFSVIK